jgi:cysteine desulfurase
MKSNPVNRYYFDHNATTPVCTGVLDALVPAMREVYGNASSIHHFGQAAKHRLEEARRQIAGMLGCYPHEVVLVSGGTEADNLAIMGAVRQTEWQRRHVITTTVEHPAVLNACAQLEREGVKVSYLRVDSRGLVDPDAVRKAILPETLLISVMHANNETGVIQPVEEIARTAREAGVLMHSDGVQAAGKLRVDVGRLGVDLYSISGHKIYAPKGVGALYVRKGIPLKPLLYGGHHERDRRAGTENVCGAIALGEAARIVAEEWEQHATQLRQLRDRLEERVLARVPAVGINGAGAERLPNTSNFWFDGLEGEPMVIALDLRGFAVSTGSACSSGAIEPSHVLKAMGLSDERARASIRVSVGRSNTVEQVDALADAIVAVSEHLRRLSPTYNANATSSLHV